ncbi:sensor histidine kinase [Chondromyces crocatus]|uniref:histidine kinase n=1 Tax=Chondromyces crocatus TaxID=52 RepID=A0A0K1EPL4_CHOCO|nr:HAMP domain-containing sensor histidine kinase [Chondromyces crocatus]AKT42759.1 chemotaxis protein CheY [Chondromyces crocatus]
MTMDKRAVDEVLIGGGECGALMRQLDWSKTAIGPVSSWPQSLRTAVGILLASNYPLYIAWGPRYVQMYNDAYRPICGATKHPASLGQEAAVTWPEVWHMLGPGFDRILATGEANWVEDLMMPLDRNGYVEECYFTYSHSPIRDERGGIGGVFSALHETTDRVLDERRLRTLRALSAATSDRPSAENACRAAAEILGSNLHDVPFALLYLVEAGGERARLVASSQLDPGAPGAPLLIEPRSAHTTTWPIAGLLSGEETSRETHFPAMWGKLPGGPWPEGASSALLLPLAQPGHTTPAGVLVAGVSPRRALDEKYKSFLQLAAAGIATGIANARAREEERRHLDALAELDRAKTAFFSNVSHEFRTPLTLVLGPLEDCLEDAQEPLGTRQQARLSTVRRNALRLLKLVNALLDFSRLEAGRMQAVREATDLSALTTDLASTFRSTMERAGLALHVDCPPLPEPAWVDREMWEKMVLNLLSNAFKFTFEGSISVRLTADEERFVLAVEDTGTGIPQQELKRVFERFHRVQGARGRSHEGSGIGLALVQELAKLHGGSIEVESSLGKGSTFTLTLPRGRVVSAGEPLDPGPERAATTERAVASTATAFLNDMTAWVQSGDAATPEQPAQVPVQPPPPSFGATVTRLPARRALLPSGHVLLVDDNADMRDYVKRLLEGRYTVETAQDGDTALEIIKHRIPDLVLSDVMMPGKDGFALLAALRVDPRTTMIPVILLSARAGEEATVEGLLAGASDYLVKPFSGRELVARVEGTLRTARARQDLDAFAGRIAHDLRNLLSPLLMMSAVFKFSSEEPARKAGERLERMTRRANNLLDGMLAFSRAEHTLDAKDSSSIPAVISDVVEDLSSLRNQVNAEIDLTGVENLRVIVPRGLLYVVVMNLMSNALKFMQGQPHRRVVVTARTRGERAELIVDDTGPGISSDALGHIFEPFYRAPGTKASGHGIGLATVQRIVQSCGGDIDVQSTPGVGTQFQIGLPLDLDGTSP